MHRFGALACSLVLAFAAGPALAQNAVQQPNPPPQICVNNSCASTPVAASTSSTNPTSSGSTTGGTGTIKWNPGNYMASYTVLGAGDTLSKVQSEMDDINGYNNILGYRVFITWGALEPSEGVYDFSLLDAIFNRLKTQYNQPKRMVVVVLPGTFGGSMPSGGSGGTIPMYLQTDSTYGASPVAGSYGWWGQNSGGASTGAFAAALYRPAVMDRMIALIQALGAHYDADPYFEALMFQEDAWMMGMWGSAPDFSASDSITQFERMLSAATAAFPHTSVIMENTWAGSVTEAENFEQWMVQNRVAPGSADTVGQTAFNMGYATASNGLAWGLQGYMGIVPAGSSYGGGDLRSQSHAMLDVEAMDLSGAYFSNWGAPNGYQPLDIIAALNSTYRASHAFWTHLFGTEPVYPGSGTVNSASPWAAWSNLAPVINANPLTNTSYPANYPQ